MGETKTRPKSARAVRLGKSSAKCTRDRGEIATLWLFGSWLDPEESDQCNLLYSSYSFGSKTISSLSR